MICSINRGLRRSPALTGGNAVYQARILLGLALDSIVDYADVCAVSYKTGGTHVDSEKNESAFRVYPNPGNGIMVLHYALEQGQTGIFTMYEPTGRKVAAYVLPAGEQELRVNEKEVQNGIYFYQFNVDGMIKKTGKLLIIR